MSEAAEPQPPESPAAEAQPEPAVLESRVRLVESGLWALQRTFYGERAAEAWSTDVIPHYITCNPSIADSYARTIVGFLRDCRAQGRIQPGQPVHVVEVGCGSGRFAFLLRRRLDDLLPAAGFGDLDVVVVATDFEESKLHRLEQHSALADDLAAGRFALATFDAEQPGPVRLLGSGVDLEPASNPMVLIANYVFDSLVMEGGGIRDGKFQDLLMSVTSTKPDASLTEPDDLASLALRVDLESAELSVIADPDLRAVAADYESQLDDSIFTLPVGGLRAVARFQEMAGDRPLLVVVGDKGWAHLPDWLGSGPPQVATHGGAFSLMLNFDALARVVVRRGGVAMLPRHAPTHLVVGAFVLGGGPEWPELHRCFIDHIEANGPDDVYLVNRHLRPETAQLDLDQMLALLRMSRWDTSVMMDWFQPLLNATSNAPAKVRPHVAAAVEALWRNYFFIGEESDVAVALGLLMSNIHYYREALMYFKRSEDLYGPTARTHFATGVAYYGLRDLDEATKRAREALALEPGLSGARNLLVTIESEQNAQTGVPVAITLKIES